MEREPDISGMEHVPESLWDRLRADPERAAEIVALEAAERFGPAAERWVRGAGAGSPPEKLAHEAYQKHVRFARVQGGTFGLGGAITVLPDLLALVWIQSRMVFFIAAAYGYDPCHPMRPAELLALQEMYSTAEEARQALDGVGTPLAQALVESRLRKGADETITAKLLRFAVKRAAKRAVGRFIPLVGAPIGAIQNAGATKDLGRRALVYYGGSESSQAV